MPWKSSYEQAVQDSVEAAAKQEVQKEDTMEKDDFLLQQIDEFREKAKQLQDLLATKETKARELQTVVSERESKAAELESFVAAKQREADDLNEGITKNVSVIMRGVDEKLDQKFFALDRSIDEKLASKTDNTETVEEMKKMLGEMKMPELDTGKITSELKAPIDEVKGAVSEVKGAVSEIKEPIADMQKEVSGMKGEILEKIHTEGVQVFRNTRDLIDEQGQKTEGIDDLKKEVKSLRTNLKIAIWFGIVNFVVLVVFALYSLGVFGV